MTLNGFLQIGIYLVVLLALVKPLGGYMARVYEGRSIGLDRLLGPLEQGMYRLCRIRTDEEMDWKTYAWAVVWFSIVSFIILYILQRLQGSLPLNPQGFGAVPPAVAFNTAASYVTKTNWQAYGGETTMSYLTQMVGLTAQDFLAPATGMVILIALIRGLVRRGEETLGNFWVDLVRTTLYILLPLAVVSSMLLISQGGIQTLDPSKTVSRVQPQQYDREIVGTDDKTLLDKSGRPMTERVTLAEQTIAVGPAATQVIARDLGTAGGGFFNANSAHPFEDPTPLADFLLLLLQTAPAAALTYTFGKMVGDTRQGWALLAAMMIVLVIFSGVAYWAESVGNPRIAALGIDQMSGNQQPGGNMEGKEARFGIARTVLVATATTATSTGAPNGMLDSLMPIGGAGSTNRAPEKRAETMKEIGIIIVCLLFNALLVLTEMAFVVVNRPSLRQLVRQGHSRAGVLLRLRETPERTLSVIQIGLTLALALAGVVGGVGAEERLSPVIKRWLEVSENMADAIAIGLVVLPLTYFTVVLGELVPKSLALRHSLSFALMTAPWLSLVEKILGPVVTVLEWSTKRFLSLLRFLLRQPIGESKEGEAADATLELDLLSTQHRQYVMNLVDLERKRIREIYLPWDKVTAVDVESVASAVEATVISSGHTRLPVLKEGRVIGILNTKEFATLRASGREDWVSLTRPVVELQAETPLLTGLRRLQEHRMHMGVVYSGKERLGVVTLEDILEEVVGEMYDEDDDGALRRLLRSGPIVRAARGPTTP